MAEVNYKLIPAADLKVAGYQEVEIDSKARHGLDSTPSSPGQNKVANTVAADLKSAGYQKVEIDSKARHGLDSTPSSPGQIELANSAQCPIEHQQFVRSVADTLNYDLPPCAKIANEPDGTISAVFDVSTTAYDEGESDFRLQVSRNNVYLSSMGLVNVCALPQKSAFFSLFELKQAPICTASMWRVDSGITNDFAKAHDLVVSHEKSKQFFLGRWLSSVVDEAAKMLAGLFSSVSQEQVAQPPAVSTASRLPEQSTHNDYHASWFYPESAALIFNPISVGRRVGHENHSKPSTSSTTAVRSERPTQNVYHALSLYPESTAFIFNPTSFGKRVEHENVPEPSTDPNKIVPKTTPTKKPATPKKLKQKAQQFQCTAESQRFVEYVSELLNGYDIDPCAKLDVDKYDDIIATYKDGKKRTTISIDSGGYVETCTVSNDGPAKCRFSSIPYLVWRGNTVVYASQSTAAFNARTAIRHYMKSNAYNRDASHNNSSNVQIFKPASFPRIEPYSYQGPKGPYCVTEYESVRVSRQVPRTRLESRNECATYQTASYVTTRCTWISVPVTYWETEYYYESRPVTKCR